MEVWKSRIFKTYFIVVTFNLNIFLFINHSTRSLSHLLFFLLGNILVSSFLNSMNQQLFYCFAFIFRYELCTHLDQENIFIISLMAFFKRWVFLWNLLVSSGLQDSSNYSIRSLQCCGQYRLDSSFDFQFFQSSFTTLCEMVLNAPTTIGIIVNQMFPIFFLKNSKYLSLSFIFTQQSTGMIKPTRGRVICLLLITTRSKNLDGIANLVVS